MALMKGAKIALEIDTDQSIADNTTSQDNCTAERSPPRRGRRFYAALGAICLVNIVVALDASVVSVALPVISFQLKATGIEAFWVGTSFLLSSTVFQPAFTSLSHLFGRKLLLLAALCFFTVGAVVAGCAHDVPDLLVGRSIQGVGGAGIVVLTSVLMTDLFALRERGKWGGFINLLWAIGSVAGPPIGGTLAQNGAWRWIFWINLPFCALAFLLIPLFLTLQPVSGSVSSKLRSFDFVGFILFTGCATVFLLGVTWGGVEFSWNSWQTIIPIVLGFTGLVLFTLYSIFIPARPLIYFGIFSSRSANCAFLCTILHGAIVFAFLYYFPLYLEGVHNFSPVKAGTALVRSVSPVIPWLQGTFMLTWYLNQIATSVTVAPGAAITGFLITKFGRYRWAVWSGWVLTTLGTGILLVLTKTSPTAELVCLSMVLGVGLGFLATSLLYSIQASSAPEDGASCGAMLALLRQFGQTLGVAVAGGIFQNQIKRHLKLSPILESQAQNLTQQASNLVAVIQQMPDGSPEKSELISAFQGSFQTFVYVMCALCAVGLVLSTMIKGYGVDQRHVTEQRFRNTY